MASSAKPSQSELRKKKLADQDIISGFQALRVEQRQLAQKISEMELDLHEHKIVIDTLNQVDENRRCFRMVGGVLVEKTVKDVLPDLDVNKTKLGSLVETLEEQLKKKGQELNEYKEKHNIRIRGQDDAESENPRHEEKASHSSAVLVNPM